MNRQEYWKWIWDIWKDPLNGNMRLVFADWLEERGCSKAAKKQRQSAAWVNSAVAAARNVHAEQIWLFLNTPTGKTRLYRMKKDGTIHPMPDGYGEVLPGTHQFLKRSKT